MADNIWFWVVFNAFVLLLLALDLGVFHRAAHEVSTREAAAWSAFWISLALAFNGVLYVWQGSEIALQFLTGYLIEKSLSIDNIFVFVLIFGALGVPKMYQHRVLFWGIVSALVLRGAMIGLGAVLIQRFHWLLYVFGAFLIGTGIKMAFQKARTLDPEMSLVVRLARRVVPVSTAYDGQRFLTRLNGRRAVTPLFLALLLVEVTDLIFAVDSIPAIFAVTTDPFLVYTSNVMAILGLRSLYFLLAGVVDRFHLLKLGLALVLVFVGAKMVAADVFKVPTAISLGVIAVLIGGSVAASLAFPKREPTPA
ncbi:MAG: TerC family protein [Ardenticatenales bacterium]|nr:TerC family protein [Ardenticatenales bacterium]